MWVVSFTLQPPKPKRRSRCGSRTGLHALNRTEIFFLCWKSNHDSAIWQSVAYSLHRMCYCGSVGMETEGVWWYPHRGRTMSQAVLLFDVHSDSNRFESKPGHRLSWQIVSWFFSVPFEKCWKSTSSRPWSLPSTSFPVHYSVSVVSCDITV